MVVSSSLEGRLWCVDESVEGAGGLGGLDGFGLVVFASAFSVTLVWATTKFLRLERIDVCASTVW